MGRRLEVAGGGIAGLTVGLAFARKGWSVRVHEQDEQLRVPGGGDIVVFTPRRSFRFDHAVCATGYALDLAARPELRRLADRVVLWRDRFDPAPAEASAELGVYPYLDDGYGFIPRSTGEGWISRVHAFNFAAFVSAGPHSTSISGHKYALPRLLRALVRRLFLEQKGGILDALRAYDELDLVIPAERMEEAGYV